LPVVRGIRMEKSVNLSGCKGTLMQVCNWFKYLEIKIQLTTDNELRTLPEFKRPLQKVPFCKGLKLFNQVHYQFVNSFPRLFGFRFQCSGVS